MLRRGGCWNSWPPGYPLYRYMLPRLYILVARVKRSVLNGYTSSPGILWMEAKNPGLVQKPRILKITGYCWWKKSGSPVDVVVLPIIHRVFCCIQNRGCFGILKHPRVEAHEACASPEGQTDTPATASTTLGDTFWSLTASLPLKNWMVGRFSPFLLCFFCNFQGGRGSWGSTLEYTSESTCFFWIP